MYFSVKTHFGLTLFCRSAPGPIREIEGFATNICKMSQVMHPLAIEQRANIDECCLLLPLEMEPSPSILIWHWAVVWGHMVSSGCNDLRKTHVFRKWNASITNWIWNILWFSADQLFWKYCMYARRYCCEIVDQNNIAIWQPENAACLASVRSMLVCNSALHLIRLVRINSVHCASTTPCPQHPFDTIGAEFLAKLMKATHGN